MIGAIIGDIAGSRFEWHNIKTKEFDFLTHKCFFTDDTVMTIAVAEAFMEAISCGATEPEIKGMLVEKMQEYGKRYPYAGYGSRFSWWLSDNEPAPYNSYGNGSAMRVSSVAWLYNDIISVVNAARISAEVTHNHPEGIKGAQATAVAIFLARTGASKVLIKSFIQSEFGYDLSRTCDQVRPTYRHVESCQETVPEAITAFLEGDSFEDVIRTAVSLGGDCDTLTAIAGSVAEAFYGVPEELKEECRNRLTADLGAALHRFDNHLKEA